MSDTWAFVQRDLAKSSVGKEHGGTGHLDPLVRWWAAARVECERLLKNGDLEGMRGVSAVE